MKRFVLLGFAVGLALATLPAVGAERGLDAPRTIQALNGSPTYLGTISVFDGGSANNWTTLAPDAGAVTAFDAGAGNLLLVQCDQNTYTKVGGGTSLAASSTDVQVDTREKYYSLLKTSQNAVAIKPESGATAACDVYRME